jgi:hypothetical protein
MPHFVAGSSADGSFKSWYTNKFSAPLVVLSSIAWVSAGWILLDR